MEIKYRINLLSDWHIGSGLSAGAKSDNNVLKDRDNLPFIPGKTIKGLLKQALMEMPSEQAPRELIDSIFGSREAGKAFFSNAVLEKLEREEIIREKLSDFLYRTLSSTAINSDGVAKEHSLRAMEVTLPLTLVGVIKGVESNGEKELLEKGLKWVRHLGVNRNRGLGRCKFEIIKE